MGKMTKKKEEIYTRNCKTCNKYFETGKSLKIFCCPHCREKSYGRRQYEKYIIRKKIAKLHQICYCGNELEKGFIWCKDCREKKAKIAKKNYESHKEEYKIRAKEWRKTHPEYTKKKAYRISLLRQLKNPTCIYQAGSYCNHIGFSGGNIGKHTLCSSCKFRPECRFFRQTWEDIKIIKGDNEQQTKVVFNEEPMEQNTNIQ